MMIFTTFMMGKMIKKSKSLKSVHLTTLRSTDKNYGGLSTNSLFSTGPAVNCFWMMNIGSI